MENDEIPDFFVICPFCGFDTHEYFCYNCLKDIDKDSETYGQREKDYSNLNKNKLNVISSKS